MTSHSTDSKESLSCRCLCKTSKFETLVSTCNVLLFRETSKLKPQGNRKQLCEGAARSREWMTSVLLGFLPWRGRKLLSYGVCPGLCQRLASLTLMLLCLQLDIYFPPSDISTSPRFITEKIRHFFAVRNDHFSAFSRIHDRILCFRLPLFRSVTER